MWPLVPLMQNSIQTDSGEQFLHRQIRASAPQKGHHFTGNLNHFHLTAPCTSEVMSGLFTDEKTHVHDHSLVRVSNPVAGLLDKTLVFVNNVLSCINTITHSTQLCLFVSEGRIGSRVSLSMTVKACSVHNTVVSQTFRERLSLLLYLSPPPPPPPCQHIQGNCFKSPRNIAENTVIVTSLLFSLNKRNKITVSAISSPWHQ